MSGRCHEMKFVSVQLIGKHWQEADLLRHAAWVEKELGFDKTPPL